MEFKIGDRVFFIGKHGLGIFGDVINIDSDETKLVVRTDDGILYEILGSRATKLGED